MQRGDRGRGSAPRIAFGWICDHLSRSHPRIEDEVEQVHDEVRDDRAEREDEQERLRQRVVVAERGLLQRVAGTGIAEDELDEDDAADRGRELCGEAVERRQDRVPRAYRVMTRRSRSPFACAIDT